MTVSEQLRQAIVKSGQTHYRLGKEIEISPRVLDQFVSRERPELRTGTVDRLCEYFGLELTKKKRATKAKPAAKRGRKK